MTALGKHYFRYKHLTWPIQGNICCDGPIEGNMPVLSSINQFQLRNGDVKLYVLCSCTNLRNAREARNFKFTSLHSFANPALFLQRMGLHYTLL